MTQKTVSQVDELGYLVGTAVADESPLEPGIFHIPGGAVDIEPAAVPAGKRAKLVDGAFVLEDIPAPPAPTREQLLKAAQDARAAAYKAEAAPLVFKCQRGEGTVEDWKAKCAEIKARIPDPA